MQLPVEVKIALERMADGQSLKSLADDYKSLSTRYRAARNGAPLQIKSAGEALAYAIARMPATYAAVHDVIGRAVDTIPAFNPRSLLDLGSGPATATLAALDHFPDMDAMHLVEPNAHLSALAREFCASATHESATLASAALNDQADLVLLSYVLNELPPADLPAILDKVWNTAAQALIIIEPGTPEGFALILKIRDHLHKSGAFIAAPCPHEHACPLSVTDGWCHMSARVERSSLHRKIKDDASLNYEDEKFSYLVATRLPVTRPAARLIGHPHGQKLISLELCNADGTANTKTLSKRDDLYKKAKKLEWGDGV